jgi:archaeal flagellar protein FlaJ
MRLGKTHWLGIIFSLILLVVDIIFFRGEPLFFFLVGIAIVVVAIPFVASLILGSKVEKEKNDRFLEFTRNLAENVKGGTPIGQSILNMSRKNYGSLTSHIKKLANQISIGIPISKALKTFADDIGSNSVRRAVTLIREAESSGGKISDILDSVASSIYQIEKLKKERKAAVSSLMVQGYVIFFIFIGIMLVMQFKILPLTADVGTVGSFENLSGDGGEGPNPEQIAKLARPFLYLLLIQGLFSGLAIGKLAEGSIKSGVKHSFVMTVTAFLVSSGARLFL